MTAFFSGANFIIDDKGQTISLASRSKDQRIALSRTLQKSVDDLDGGGTEQPKKVIDSAVGGASD